MWPSVNGALCLTEGNGGGVAQGKQAGYKALLKCGALPRRRYDGGFNGPEPPGIAEPGLTARFAQDADRSGGGCRKP